jgi:hypothetical protein
MFQLKTETEKVQINQFKIGDPGFEADKKKSSFVAGIGYSSKSKKLYIIFKNTTKKRGSFYTVYSYNELPNYSFNNKTLFKYIKMGKVGNSIGTTFKHLVRNVWVKPNYELINVIYKTFPSEI